MRKRMFSFHRIAHKHALRVCSRLYVCVYETYFPVEPFSIAELQRQRANRRALPNANTVFTCDCSWMHLAARDGERGYNRISISSHLAVSLTDDPYSLRIVRGLSSLVATEHDALFFSLSHCCRIKFPTIFKLTLNNFCSREIASDGIFISCLFAFSRCASCYYIFSYYIFCASDKVFEKCLEIYVSLKNYLS